MTGTRVFDIVFSTVALVALTPVMLLIGVAVLLDSGGPIFFSQIRVGRNFQPFLVRKFRTMNAGEGPPITSADDRRVTRVGAFLRRTKLDELPQLWNVLIGSMSVVGPRPELPQFVEHFPAQYKQVLRVRPGLTDPASLRFWNEEEVLAGAADPVAFYAETILPRKLKLSTHYLESRSWVGDGAVVLRTISKFIGGAFRP